MGNKQPKNNNNTPEPDEEKSPVDEEKISPNTRRRMTEWEQNKTKIESLTEKDGDYNKTLKLYTRTKKRGEQLLDAIKRDLIDSGFEDGARYVDALIEFIELNTLEVYSAEQGATAEQNINNLFNNLEPAVALYININIMPVLDDYFKILVDIEKLTDDIHKNKRHMSKLVFKNDDLGSIFALTAKPKKDRTRAHKKLNDIISNKLIMKETSFWLELFKKNSIPCGPINNIEEVFNDDYAEEQQFVHFGDNKTHNSIPTVKNPVKFSNHETMYTQAAPVLGEHKHYILRNLLNYSDDEITSLESKNII